MNSNFDMEIELTKEFKESNVADPNSCNDISGMIAFRRDGKLISVVAVTPDRDRCLMVARTGIVGFGADNVVMHMETYGRVTDKVDDDPMMHPDGREWQRGEMQEMFEAGRGEEFNITEQIMITRYERVGKGCVSSFMALPYRIEGSSVIWKDMADYHEGSVSGYVNDCMVSFFEEGPLDLDMVQKMFYIEQGEFDNSEKIPHRRLHADLGALRAVANALKEDVAISYLNYSDDPEEEEIVRESVKKIGNESVELQRRIAMMTN